MTIRDSEVIEALSDDAELLAVADAIATTRRAHGDTDRSYLFGRRWIGAAAAGFAAAAALVLLLLAPWEGGGAPSLTERALAAVGGQPVLHGRIRFGVGDRVDLATGRVTMAWRDAEVWYDEDTDVARTVVHADGRVVTRQTTRGNSFVDNPVLLAEEYRRALAQGAAREVGSGTVGGVSVIWVELPASRLVLRAALDARTLDLKRLLYVEDGRVVARIDVLVLESVSREEAQLPPADRVQSTDGGVTSSGSTTEVSPNCARRGVGCDPPPVLDLARTKFGRPALWPGPEILGRRLATVSEQESEAESTGRRERADLLVLGYGPSSPMEIRFLNIEEAPAAAARRLWELQGDVVPPAGYVDISGGRTTSGSQEVTTWTGVLRRHGFYVRIESLSRRALIAAARALRPVPPA